MYANTYAHIHAHAAAILISKHNLMPIDYSISSLIATMAHYPLQDFGPQASSPSQDFGPQADWHHQSADRVGVNGFPLEEVLPPDPTAADIQAGGLLDIIHVLGYRDPAYASRSSNLA